MKLLFVRHGKSIANARGMIGTPDTPLADEGLEQARVTGRDLCGHNVTKIVSSPYIRARQTAEIVASELGLAVGDIVIVDELHERRMGTLEGLPKQHGTEYFYKNDYEHGFESQSELIARMKMALANIREISAATEGVTVAVGHATSGFYLLQVAKGREKFVDFDPVNQMDNAEFVEIELG